MATCVDPTAIDGITLVFFNRRSEEHEAAIDIAFRCYSRVVGVIAFDSIIILACRMGAIFGADKFVFFICSKQLDLVDCFIDFDT